MRLLSKQVVVVAQLTSVHIHRTVLITILLLLNPGVRLVLLQIPMQKDNRSQQASDTVAGYIAHHVTSPSHMFDDNSKLAAAYAAMGNGTDIV